MSRFNDQLKDEALDYVTSVDFGAHYDESIESRDCLCK